MNGLWQVVFRKELKDAFRDKRALSMLALFVFLFPFMIMGVFQSIISKVSKADRETIEIVVINGEQAPNLLQRLERGGITIVKHADMDEAAISSLLAERKMAAVLKFDPQYGHDYAQLRPATIELWQDSAAEMDAKVKRVQSTLRQYNSEVAQLRLMARGVSSALLAPVAIAEFDTASSESRSGRLVGAMLGMLFVYIFYYCFNTTVDITAGERERKSLETLMAQPIDAFSLLVGKSLAASVLCVLGLSAALFATNFVLQQLPLEVLGVSWRIGADTLMLLIFAALPLCLFAPIFEIALAMNSKSFKEAQTLVSFALFLPLIPVIVVPMLDLKTQLWMYAVPVLGEQTLMLELAKGQAIGILPFALTMGVSLVLATICFTFATWRLKSERFVLGV